MVGSRPLSAVLHDAASVHVLQPLYDSYRGVRPAYRAAVRAYREGLAARTAAARWSEDRKRDWILDRLRRAVRFAYAESEFYRRRLDEIGFDPEADFGFDEFAALPPLEREEISAAGESIRARGIPLSRLRRDSTGGTSGQPTVVWRGPQELGWNESGTEHFMRRIGVPRGSSTGLLWGHHLDPVGSDRLRDRLRFFLDNLQWFDCLRLSPEVFDRYHERLLEWRPRVVIAYAGALGAFAEHLASRGIRNPPYPTYGFVTGAEKLLPHHREAVQEVFGRPVHERYGSRDVALLGFQTRPSVSLEYEIDWANVLVEPETTDPASPILVTKLHADGMPMLRYRIGDMGRFPAGSRPGHPAFTLDEVLGREVDRVWLPDGRWVNGLGFPHLMKDYDVKMFQIVQESDFSVTIRVVPRGHLSADAQGEILALVRANLAGLPVAIEVVDDIARTKANKWRPVVSRVDAASLRGIA